MSEVDDDSVQRHQKEEFNQKKCIFCQIATKEKESAIVYEDDDVLVFPDIRPAARHHYLVIPRIHVGDPKSLCGKDIGLVERLVAVGKQVLQEKDVDTEDSRMGFHWPPFNSVQHLHLHAISPVSEMGFIARHVYRPDSWWFVTASWLLESLRKQTDAQQGESSAAAVVEETKQKSPSSL